MPEHIYPDVYLPIYKLFHNLSRDIESLWRIFDLLPIGVMATNQNGIIIYYNRAHGRLDDLSPREVLGRPENEVFGFPSPGPGIMRTCQKMKRPILGFMCSYFTKKKPERLIKGAYWVFPLFDTEKNISGSLCITMPMGEDETLQITPFEWTDNSHDNDSSKKIIGQNLQLNKVIRLAKNNANSPSPVLISGETGTGKELFARLIHDSSKRANKLFAPINCSAIPGTLLEGLLFGTTRGSFTGAIDRAGLLEEATGGTVYLDEIDSMPLELQPKLLRVLQEMKFSRLGSSKEIKLNVKIISSISTPISEILSTEKLRADIFYRLAVIVLNIPPLRDRMDDFNELVNAFIVKYNKTLKKRATGFDANSMRWLHKHTWPGNVRELENLVAAAINMADQHTLLTIDHLPEHFLYMIEQFKIKETLYSEYPGIAVDSNLNQLGAIEKNNPLFIEVSKRKNPDSLGNNKKTIQSAEAKDFQASESKIIEEALKLSKGCITKAAKITGLSRQLLTYKIKKYSINRFHYLPQMKLQISE